MTRRLLLAGTIAGPWYLIVGFGQAFLREGFDVRRHALSQLSQGEYGWIQVANFLIAAVLVMAGAAGVRQGLRGQRGGTWGPLLLGVYGLGLLGAGIFPAEPGNGFPPGSETQATPMSTDGLLHFVFGGLGFYALTGACFVVARRFMGSGERGLAWYSALSGVLFFGSFAAIASGPPSPAVMLMFYAAVTWIWIWHTTVLWKFRRTISA